MKRKALAIVLIAIIALAIITWLFQNKTNLVKIETFTSTEIWEYFPKSGTILFMPFNLTLHNTGINNVSGLNLSVAIFVNDTSKIEAVFLNVLDARSKSRIDPHNFTLLAGEVQEVEGWISATIDALEQAGAKMPISIDGANSGWNYVATVTLGDEVLDEFRLHTRY